MPSPDPRIKPLLLQAGFLDVVKLGQIKIDDTLVTALVESGDLNHTRFIFMLVNAQSPWKMLLFNWVYALMENQLLAQHIMIRNICAHNI